jgi:hypothetical protein
MELKLKIDWCLGSNRSYTTSGVLCHSETLRHRYTIHMKSMEISFAVLKPKKRVERQSESDLKFLLPIHCLGFWPIHRVTKVQKLQDQFSWKEDLIFHNFSRNTEVLICTFYAPNLTLNIRKGKNPRQKRKLTSYPLEDKARIYIPL